MTWPVLPPILPNELVIVCEALLREEPADEETLVRPSEAFDVTWLADSFAFVAPEEAALAASDVVEALRISKRPACGRRTNAREAEENMMQLESVSRWVAAQLRSKEDFWRLEARL